MKSLLNVLFIGIVSVMAGCCVHTGIRHPGERATIVDTARDSTVALVHMDKDNDIMAYCAGVWINRTMIVTARHCAAAVLEDTLSDKMPAEEVEETVEKFLDGTQLTFTTSKDDMGFLKKPKTVHTAIVLKHDSKHDLALLEVNTKDVPEHGISRPAETTPAVGDTVHVMGHVASLPWTYTTGVVAAYRERDFKLVSGEGIFGPWMQVAGEVFHGNSGGGGFNDDGELVGICSFGLGRAVPNESFFIHVDTIKAFVGTRNLK